ncbi:MAG: hypothetical protein Q9166_006327 [cf. Caloplaca sp. 2 TL-2023]
MSSNVDEAYMLPRNIQESRRLDAQHEYMRALSYGHLIHSSIPARQLHAVADVATGTGVWLRHLAEDPALPRSAARQDPSFVGFDISKEQFPPTQSLPPHVKLVVHDMVEPFPAEYHERFDLVNVRLVSYAIKGSNLDRVVRNVIQLLRPGGYLQWQETDASDSWAHPETPTATSCVNHVIAEKIDRGLLPGIAGPLVKAIVSLPATLADGQKNPISWSEDLMRLIHLQTVSTLDHPSSAVEEGKKAAVMSAATALLMARISRKTTELESADVEGREAERLREEVESMNKTLKAIQSGDDTNSSWDFDVTWIVARKAIAIDITKGWMSIKKPSS